MQLLKKLNEQKNILFGISLFIVFFYYCSKKDSPTPPPDGDSDTTSQIIVLYTNDEHGWMEPTATHGGAAGLMGLWRKNENYTENGPFLILSGGDNWTGPAISTWTRGESMTDVMNSMGYSVTVIGNHEFDFKIEGLKERIAQANFSFLSANIREKTTGKFADIAIPYLIKEVNGVKVGLIGLTTTLTPYTTFPENVKDFDFIAYDTALEEIVPQVKKDGAELLIVVGHICYSEMQALVSTAAELGITVIGGGHCHERVSENIDGVAIIEAGSDMMNYAKVDILFDTIADTVISMKQSIHENQGGTPDSEIETIVTYWQSQVDVTLSQVIGYVNQEIDQRSNVMYNMITDSWLFTYPSADISLTNRGGIRQSIPAGDITLGTIVGVLPFENNIVEVELTGTQLIDCIDNLVMGGMTSIGGYQLSDGAPIHPDTTYHVLTTDFLYARTDYNFQRYDSDPYNTSIHYRQPVIDWIKSLNTTSENPLDQYLDYNPR